MNTEQHEARIWAISRQAAREMGANLTFEPTGGDAEMDLLHGNSHLDPRWKLRRWEGGLIVATVPILVWGVLAPAWLSAALLITGVATGSGAIWCNRRKPHSMPAINAHIDAALRAQGYTVDYSADGNRNIRVP